jgi:RNA polymerase sigma factor (sigma-70 family)
VYRSLYNRVVDSFRRKRTVLSLDESVNEQGGLPLRELLSDNRFDAQNALERKEIRERLYAALEGLSFAQREVFIATTFEGRTFRELSEQWGIPIGTLLSQKHRAVQKIRSALRDVVSESLF